MPKGKKLTYKQREIMKDNGITDCTEWRYIKLETLESDSKHLKPGTAKSVFMVVKNIHTGEKIKVQV